MPQCTSVQSVLCGLAVLTALTGAPLAEASDSRCPPGMTSPDGNVCVPGNSLHDEVNAIINRPPNVLPAPDPELERLQARTNERAAAVAAMAQLLDDPDYQRYLTGKWKLSPAPEGVNSGEFCNVYFSREGVILTLTGPGGDYKGAGMISLSADIPRPRTQQTVEVTLTQDNEAPVTVQALNYSSPGHAFGSIALAVPSMDALLDNMVDDQRFVLHLDGKQIAKVQWHSGLAARSELRRCLDGKPYTVSQIDLIDD